MYIIQANKTNVLHRLRYINCDALKFQTKIRSFFFLTIFYFLKIYYKVFIKFSLQGNVREFQGNQFKFENKL